MHHAHNRVHRAVKEERIERELAQFGANVEEVRARSLSDRVKPATALMGYDPDRVAATEYPWLVP